MGTAPAVLRREDTLLRAVVRRVVRRPEEERVDLMFWLREMPRLGAASSSRVASSAASSGFSASQSQALAAACTASVLMV